MMPQEMPKDCQAIVESGVAVGVNRGFAKAHRFNLRNARRTGGRGAAGSSE